MKPRIDALLKTTLENCFNAGLLARVDVFGYVIEIPKNADHGHFATNLPMTLASAHRKNPREIASIIVKNLVDSEGLLEKVDIAGPGFINFTIRSEEWRRVLQQILEQHRDFGRSETGRNQRVLVEFVSANPTGPPHLGHGRGAALGDTLCRILSFCGYQVAREFYINDAGLQVKLLGESIWARLRQMADANHPFPENGYHGDYILDLAKTLRQNGDPANMDRDEGMALCSETGKKLMLDEIKAVLGRFGVAFDVWTSEKSLLSSGLIEKTLESIQEKGHVYEAAGALWIETSDFGDDKDRVIRKSDGQLTYFASDIAYHLEKHRRGFTRAINIWGADHHGYVPRMQAALRAHGISERWLSVLLIQLVKLWRKGEELKMSKRAGSFVTLQELLDEVGVDAARFVFLSKSHDSPLDVDMDLVKKQDSDNPVYYVQYAHARISSIIRKAESEGISVPKSNANVAALLELPQEMALIRTLTKFPSLLEDIAQSLEAHRLTYYLTELSAMFHQYFNMGTKKPSFRVVSRDLALTEARLMLISGIRNVIANGLNLLGVSAPEKM